MTDQVLPSHLTKRCSLLRRRRDLSVEAFRAYWAGPHAALACRMPGIKQYTQNRMSEPLWTLERAGFDCDGIVELEFRDQQILAEANKSDTARRLLPADEPNFMEAITLCAVSEGARQIWTGMQKVMLAAVVGANVSFDRVRELCKATGCREHSFDSVSGTFHRDGLPYETEPPNLFATLWFDAGDNLEELFSSRSLWPGDATKCFTRGSAWLADPLAVVS